MALNPPIHIKTNQPYRSPNEHFILDKTGLEFEIIIGTLGKINGQGKCALSTYRLVLINNNEGQTFKSFDLPLAYMYQENYMQPVFSTNYIEGFVQPLVNS